MSNFQSLLRVEPATTGGEAPKAAGLRRDLARETYSSISIERLDTFSIEYNSNIKNICTDL